MQSHISKIFCAVMALECLITYALFGWLFLVPTSDSIEIYTFLGKLNLAALVFTHLSIAVGCCAVALLRPKYTLYIFVLYLAFVFWGMGAWPKGQYTQEYLDYIADLQAQFASEGYSESTSIRLTARVYPFLINKLLYVAGGCCAIYLLFKRMGNT